MQTMTHRHGDGIGLVPAAATGSTNLGKGALDRPPSGRGSSVFLAPSAWAFFSYMIGSNPRMAFKSWGRTNGMPCRARRATPPSTAIAPRPSSASRRSATRSCRSSTSCARGMDRAPRFRQFMARPHRRRRVTLRRLTPQPRPRSRAPDGPRGFLLPPIRPAKRGRLAGRPSCLTRRSMPSRSRKSCRAAAPGPGLAFLGFSAVIPPRS